MNSIVNLNMVIEKELELERWGLRRSRRWIGDAGLDVGWYQNTVNWLAKTPGRPEKVGSGMKVKPRRQVRRTFLHRLLSLFGSRQKPASGEC